MTSERNYSTMQPEELRGELLQLYDYLPSSHLRGNPTPLGVDRKMAEMMCQRLERILKQSELTESMQELIVTNFSLSARIGIENDDRRLLLGLQNPFTPTGAEFVGRRLVESYSEQYRTTMNIIVQLQIDGHEPPITNTLRLFLKAKKEFEEKYR